MVGAGTTGCGSCRAPVRISIAAQTSRDLH